MKIQQNSISTDRGERARQTERIATETGATESRMRQIGMDRVEVSRIGEVASAMVEHTMQQRQEKVSALAVQFQTGNYHPNLATLSQSILDHDLETDVSYAG